MFRILLLAQLLKCASQSVRKKQMNMHSHTFVVHSGERERERVSLQVASATFHLTLQKLDFFLLAPSKWTRIFSARFTHSLSTVQENNF